jgi:hypothetical protein
VPFCREGLLRAGMSSKGAFIRRGATLFLSGEDEPLDCPSNVLPVVVEFRTIRPCSKS